MKSVTSQKPLALVVDDEPAMRIIFREALEDQDFRVEEAENGLQALSLFEELAPDIVLLDVLMPELDGIQTCAAIRAMKDGEHVPILMVTGVGDTESINQAYEAGATDFVTKPVNWAILGERVRYMMRATQAFEQLRNSEANLEEMVSRRTAELRETNEYLEREIEERKRIEKELKSSEEQLRILFEYAPDAFYLNDLQGRFIDGNRVAEEVIGYKKEEMIGKNFLHLNLLPPEYVPKAVGLLAKNREGQRTGPDEFTLYRGDGSKAAVEISTYPVTIGDEVVVLGIGRDVTYRKQAEEALHRKDAILEAVSYSGEKLLKTPNWGENIREILAHLGEAAEASRVYIFETAVNENGSVAISQRYEWVGPGVAAQIDNPELQNFSLESYGFQRWGEIMGRGEPIRGLVRDFPGSEQAVLAEQDIQSLLAVPIMNGLKWWGFIGFDECRYEREWSDAEVDALKTAAQGLGAAIQRTDADKALKDSEARYRQLIEHAPAGIYEIDFISGLFTSVNDVMCNYTGYTKEEFLALSPLDILSEQSRKIYLGRVQMALAGEDVPETTIYQLKAKHGREMWAMINANWVFDENGLPIGARVVAQDITDRKRAEDALRDSEKRYRLLAENITDVLWTMDMDMRINYITPSIERLSGYSTDEIMALRIQDCVTPESFQTITKAFAEEMRLERTPGSDLSRARILEAEFIRKDGFHIWCEITISFIRDEHGRAIGVLGVTRDITERKEAAEELKKAHDELELHVQERTAELVKTNRELQEEIAERNRVEERLRETSTHLRTLINTIPDYISFKDSQGRYLMVNKALLQFTGLKQEDILGKDNEEIMPHDFALQCTESDRLTLETGSVVHKEEMYVGRDENTLFFDTVKAPFYDQSDRIVGLVAVRRDITERKRSENALRQSEETSRALLNASINAAFLIDTFGTILAANEPGARALDKNPDSIVGRNINSFSSEKIENFRKKKALEAIQSAKPVRFQDEVAGSYFDTNIYPIIDNRGNVARLAISSFDITDRKRAENALRQHNEYLTALHETAIGLLSRLDLEDLLKAIINRAGYFVGTQMGYVSLYNEEKDVLEIRAGSGYFSDYVGYSTKPGDGVSGKVLQTGQPLFIQDYLRWEGRHPDHHWDRLRALCGVPLKSGTKVMGVFGLASLGEDETLDESKIPIFNQFAELASIAIDNAQLYEKMQRELSERTRAEEQLRDSKSFLDGIIRSLTSLMIMVDEDLTIVWANEVTKELFGQDVLGKRGDMVFPGLKDHVDSFPKMRMDEFNLADWEMEVNRDDDNRAYFSCTASIGAHHDDGSIKSLVIVCKDTTEKKALQAETMRAGQLASLGELAAGVAHEINNPINGIINYAQILLDESNGNEEWADISTRIIKEGERVAGIVTNLLSFARERKDERVGVQIPDVLSASLHMAESQLQKSGIKIITEVADHLPDVIANSQQIQQIFLNLLSNARYALNQRYPGWDENKVLFITAEEILFEGTKYVRTVFHDRGVGIPGKTMERICDPFFTTKPSGEGTGLGLSISHGIIKDHKGRLFFESEEGKYTKIIVDLPAGRG